jgi:hypothetical protein
MLSPSDFNNAVPQFTNGDYASNPINPQYIAEPGAEDYNRGSEPLQTLPAQWWNWFLNGFTKRFNKVNIYVKNIFNEITQLLSLVSVTPSGTEDSPTVGQLKDMFETKYPDYLKTTPALSDTYVPKTTKVNGHALSDNVTITRSDLGLGTSATLDAGSAVGNVPVVGTALGTTNGNILMTDANGKLKPSDITTGTSAGNIPLIGTALGTTNNNIVVTDANGKLKSSGTTIGSAAGKTAGAAAGNVPLVGTALGTTNNNIVVTDTSGQLKPSGTTLGSAAGKTAGSAVGNVPLVGTALGTTNNNIVVTDTSGQLKPSGTTLGSAAGKTAGSAVGNVPLVGTALGSTDKNIVVTDTAGKLKPSGTAIGSAAGKTAGSAAGNVPLVGTALGTTDNNIVVTNTNGAVKPFGKTPNQIAYWGNGGGVCSEAASAAAKTVAISGFALYTGVTVKVMFTNGNSNNTPTLNVNDTGAKNIKVIKAGQKITPPVHSGKWRGAGSATNEAWQPLTTLELMYDGTDWVIIGNPIVEDYYSASQSYKVYANGLVEQCGLYTFTSSDWITITYPVSISTMIYFAATPRTTSDGSTASSGNPVTFRSINTANNTFLFAFKDGNGWRCSWEIKGN